MNLGSGLRLIAIVIGASIASTSCDQKENKSEAIRNYDVIDDTLMPWCYFDHKDVPAGGDSLFIFTVAGWNEKYALVINSTAQARRHYNARYYQLDTFKQFTGNGMPKMAFSETMMFKVSETQFLKVVNGLDSLLDQTGAEADVDMLDGTEFIGYYNGEIRRVTTGPVKDKWIKYADYLLDSMIRPMRSSYRKARREGYESLDPNNP